MMRNVRPQARRLMTADDLCIRMNSFSGEVIRDFRSQKKTSFKKR